MVLFIHNKEGTEETEKNKKEGNLKGDTMDVPAFMLAVSAWLRHHTVPSVL